MKRLKIQLKYLRLKAGRNKSEAKSSTNIKNGWIKEENDEWYYYENKKS